MIDVQQEEGGHGSENCKYKNLCQDLERPVILRCGRDDDSRSQSTEKTRPVTTNKPEMEQVSSIELSPVNGVS